MLIEFWERLRGYDKWVETQATVESSRTENIPIRGGEIHQNDDVLLWTDSNGERHRAYFEVQGDSSLYELDPDSKITIRYNPADPEQYCLRELLKYRVTTTTIQTAIILGVVVVFGFLIWMRLH
jgi:hypothetical protein